MNDRPDLSQFKPHVNAEVIDVLKKALALAESGMVASVGLVMVAPLGQISAISVGSRTADVYLGLDLLKGDITAAMKRGAGLRQG